MKELKNRKKGKKIEKQIQKKIKTVEEKKSENIRRKQK